MGSWVRELALVASLCSLSMCYLKRITDSVFNNVYYISDQTHGQNLDKILFKLHNDLSA